MNLRISLCFLAAVMLLVIVGGTLGAMRLSERGARVLPEGYRPPLATDGCPR